MVDGEFDVAEVENSCNELACLGNVSLGQPNGLESELELLRGKEENPVRLNKGRMEGEGAHACRGSARQGWKGKRRELMRAAVRLDKGMKGGGGEPMRAAVWLDKGRKRGVHSC